MLRSQKRKAMEELKGEGGKGKSPKTKEVEDLETHLAEAEANVVKETMNDKGYLPKH